MVKPNGLLVTVSSACCHTYTSVLSTWSSSTALLSFRLGNLISRKVSRLYAFSAYPDQTSLTQLCRWCDNWITRGLFRTVRVLSYLSAQPARRIVRVKHSLNPSQIS